MGADPRSKTSLGSSPEIIERLEDGIERPTDPLLVKTRFLSASSALKLRAVAHPSEAFAALKPTVRAANDLDLAIIERAFTQGIYTLLLNAHKQKSSARICGAKSL
jgi:hypothetical protein